MHVNYVKHIFKGTCFIFNADNDIHDLSVLKHHSLPKSAIPDPGIQKQTAVQDINPELPFVNLSLLSQKVSNKE